MRHVLSNVVGVSAQALHVTPSQIGQLSFGRVARSVIGFEKF